MYVWYDIEVIESEVKDFEMELNIKSSDFNVHENITKVMLAAAAEMFLYLISCPNPQKQWFLFYYDLFQNKNLDVILLTLNRIILKASRNGGKENYHKYIARKLYMKSSKFAQMDNKFQNISELKSAWNEGKIFKFLTAYYHLSCKRI